MKIISRSLVGMAVAFALGVASAQPAQVPRGGAATPPSYSTDAKSEMARMNEHMQRMQSLHDKMASANPEERQKLMAEQRQEMQQGMAMMQQMEGRTMMGAGVMGGGMMGPGPRGATGQKARPMDQSTRMQMMEKRMDMMQMMMQSMMDQQSGMGMGAIPSPSK